MTEVHNCNEDARETVEIQVCYASPQKVTMIELTVKSNTTIREAIEFSQISIKHPELDVNLSKVGIFGKLKMLNASVQQGDRVEIYRPLIADPMEARRRRSAKQSGKK